MNTYPLGDRAVSRIGYGAMQLAGPGVFGPPKDFGGLCWAGRHRPRREAILAAVALADADHVGAVLGQHRGAVGTGDGAAEVEDADAVQ